MRHKLLRRASDEERIGRLARRLRRDQTPSELLLLTRLKALPCWYTSQKPMTVGPFHYILDYYCARHRIAIEIDGAPHRRPLRRAYDELRDRQLQEIGVRTLRFWNGRVLAEPEVVAAEIEEACRAPAASLVIRPATEPVQNQELHAGNGGT